MKTLFSHILEATSLTIYKINENIEQILLGIYKVNRLLGNKDSPFLGMVSSCLHIKSFVQISVKTFLTNCEFIHISMLFTLKRYIL